MSQVVRHVGQVGALRRDARDRLERLVHAEMRGVLLVAQRVDHQRVDAGDERPRFAGDRAAVREVGEVAEAESEDRHLAVEQRHRHDAHAGRVERPGDLVGVNLRNAAALPRDAVEDVGEGPPDVLPHVGRGIAGDRAALHEVEAADVVESGCDPRGCA